MNKLEKPLNSHERYLYNINVRLDALIHMLSSFLEVYAKKNELAVTSNEVKEELPKTRRKSTKK